MTLLTYTQRSTLLHRLHPAAKAVWLLSMGLILSLYFNPIPLVILFLISLPFFIIGQIPWRKWSRPLGYVLLLGMIGYFVIGLWLNRPGVFTRNSELMGITFVRISGENFFLGPMAITVRGLMYTASQTLRSLTLVLMVAVFVYSTPPNDLVYLLSKARLHPKLVFIVMVAYRFFPHIFHKLSTVIAAQKLRGWNLSLSNPILMARQFLPITVPVLTETVRLSDSTTWAVESRAYGSGHFTLHHELKVSKRDWLFSIFWLVIMAVYLWLFIVYGIGPL